MLEVLQLGFFAMPFVVAMLLALGLAVFVATAFSRPAVGLGAVALLCLFETLVPFSGPIDLGLKIYLPDVITSLLGLVAVMRVLLSRRSVPVLLAWYLFVGVLGLSFAFGLSAFGTAAGGSLRPYFYGVAVASYFMTFRLDAPTVRALMSGFALLGFTLVAIVFFRWVVVALPIAALLPPGGTFDATGSSRLRTVGAEDAAAIAQLFAVALFYAQTSRLLQYTRMLLPLLLVAVVGLQHRSVWAALVAGLAARFMLPAAGRRGSTQVAVLVLAMAVLASPLLLTGLGGVGQDVTRSASRAVALADTAQVRLDSWKFAYDKWREGGARAFFIGLPLGTPMDRLSVTSTQAIQRISFQAHNFYVQTLFNFGLLGLGAMLFVYGWTLRALYHAVKDTVDGPVASALMLMLVVQLGFYMTYGIHYVQGLVLGMAVAFARQRLLPQPAVESATAPPRSAWARGRVAH